MIRLLIIFCSVLILIHCEPIELSDIILHEHVPIGYLVLKLNRTINETYSYRFVNTNQRDIQRYFFLNSSTGELTIKMNMNRSLICSNRYIQCKIILKIFELYHEILYHIPIIIEDNDKFQKIIFPYNTSEIVFHLSENSPIYQTKLFIQQQQQIYNHDYKQWKYQLKNIEKHFPFIIEINNDLSSNRLALVLIQALDRESIDQYNCTLYVTDTKGNEQQLHIKIIVDDVNDHSPIFESDKYSVELSENTLINTTILRVHATDADIGLNGHIVYDFSDASKQYSSIFSINNKTGVIQLRSLLDYEQRTSYIFYIEAHDLGQEIRSSQTLINITILDENDNYPEINFRFLPDMTYNPSKNLLQIPETYPIDKFFFQILVTDQDSPINSQIHVWFKTNDTSFNFYPINNSTYFLNRTQSFDFESQQIYQLNFYAEDFHPKNPLQTKKVLLIKILDENDNYPQFVHSFYHLSIQENNKINLILTQIQAYDLDQGENSRITYEIITNQTKFPFSIDPNTGILRCLQSFDREKRSEYHFDILARDHGYPKSLSSQVPVHINIEDINDNQPKFEHEKYEYSIEEDFDIQKSFGLIRAFDRDINSQLLYRIDNNENLFYINQNGEIFFRKPIDRETKDQYQFNVIVSDNYFQTSVPVFIRILDVNDCKPIWKMPSENHTKLFLNKDLITIGMKILKFEAIDNDDIANGNGLVSYFLENTYEFLDLINQNELILNSTPNLGYYSLEIHAKDNGKSVQYSSMTQIDLFIGDNQTNGSIYNEQKFHINSLPALKRVVLLITFFLSIAFILIFVITFIFILICRSKKQKYLYYIQCNKDQNTPHSNMIVVDSNSDSSKLSLEDIQQTSLIDHSASPSYTGTNIYTPHHQITSTLKPTQATSDYYSSSSKHEEDVDEWIDEQQQRTRNDYNTDWSIEKILYPDWLYKDRTFLTPSKQRFNTSTFNDSNPSQTFERNESIRSYSSNGKRIISANTNQLSPKQVRFGYQEEIHSNPTIRQIRTGTMKTTIQNNQPHHTFI